MYLKGPGFQIIPNVNGLTRSSQKLNDNLLFLVDDEVLVGTPKAIPPCSSLDPSRELKNMVQLTLLPSVVLFPGMPARQHSSSLLGGRGAHAQAPFWMAARRSPVPDARAVPSWANATAIWDGASGTEEPRRASRMADLWQGGAMGWRSCSARSGMAAALARLELELLARAEGVPVILQCKSFQ